MKHIITFIVSITLLLSFTSCKKKETKVEEPVNNETTNPTLTLLKIGETYLNGANAKAVVYSTKELETGYNQIYVALYDSTDGSRLSRGHFEVIPMMDMGSMQHSSPVENTEDTTTTDGYFKSGVVFTMPGDASQWSLNFAFHNHKNESMGRGSLGMAVKASTPARSKSTLIFAENNAALYLTFANPLKPAVGINDLEILLHKKISNDEYAPVDDYTIVMEPTMPSMGHSSPNNVNPVLTANGHYKGKVNFTMSGLWHINLKLYKAGVLLSDDQFFEITID
ncbi:MAG: FixH family protein [Bacteroidia bacterium]|nr:FixH family protein [Bacteroidia bacterium]